MSLEKSLLRLGYVPLLDAAPLIVAAEKGFFARQGLEVELYPLSAWASVRDRVAAGVLDGAQLLAPMLAASRLGLDGLATPLASALVLSREGNTVVVSESLYAALAEAAPEGLGDAQSCGAALARVVRTRALRGKSRLSFAHVHPHSMHHLLLRRWLAAAGLDAERDLRLCAISPPVMVSHLEADNVDGCCVGAPWGALAEAAGCGRTLLNSAQIWPGHIEKVLAVSQRWAQAHPDTHVAMTAALIEAARWAEAPENSAELARLLITVGRLPATQALLRQILEDRAQSGAPRFRPLDSDLPDAVAVGSVARQLLSLEDGAHEQQRLAAMGEAWLPKCHQAAITLLNPSKT